MNLADLQFSRNVDSKDELGKYNGVKEAYYVTYGGEEFGLVAVKNNRGFIRKRLIQNKQTTHLQCTQCEKLLPVGSFRLVQKKGKKNPTYEGQCTSCKKQYHKKRYDAGYNDIKKEAYYSGNKDKARERYQNKKNELLAYNKQWQEDNPLKYKVSVSNNRSKPINGGVITAEEFRQVCERFIDGDTIACPYCERRTPYTLSGFHLEHFIPLTTGGNNLISNVIPCCGYCNRAKSGSDFFEWSRDYFGYNSIITPYQVQKRMVDYFKKYYDIDYSNRINVKPD